MLSHLLYFLAWSFLPCVSLQVLKKRLAVNAPMLVSGGFMYEEGEGLEEDEVRVLGAEREGKRQTGRYRRVIAELRMSRSS